MADVKNISIRSNRLEEITIDGDPSRVIRLDLSDVGVLTRYKDAAVQMDEVEDIFRSASAKAGAVKDDELALLYAQTIAEAESKLAGIIDGIFNAEVCAPCAGGASLFTPVDGMLLYERIVEAIAALYGDELKRQTELRRKRIAKHTGKYAAKA